MVDLLSRPWQAPLGDLVARSRESLLIATPYIKWQAARWLLDTLDKGGRAGSIRATVMTDISPDSALNASLDLEALVLLSEHLPQSTVFDLHRLHAKVYVSDDTQAIVTSGNLTSAALLANYEYGVVIRDPRAVRAISRDMRSYARAGRKVGRDELLQMAEAEREFRGRFQQEAGRQTDSVERELAREWNQIASAFGGPPEAYEVGSARFKGPIIEVLSGPGPLATTDLCDAIQASWPHLCDDAVARVAKDGTRKRQWRQDIHTAQETLQRAGVLRRDAKGFWHLQGRKGQ